MNIKHPCPTYWISGATPAPESQPSWPGIYPDLAPVASDSLGVDSAPDKPSGNLTQDTETSDTGADIKEGSGLSHKEQSVTQDQSSSKLGVVEKKVCSVRYKVQNAK